MSSTFFSINASNKSLFGSIFFTKCCFSSFVIRFFGDNRFFVGENALDIRFCFNNPFNVGDFFSCFSCRLPSVRCNMLIAELLLAATGLPYRLIVFNTCSLNFNTCRPFLVYDNLRINGARFSNNRVFFVCI